MSWPAYWPAASGDDIQNNHFTDDIDSAGRQKYYAYTGGDMAGGTIALAGQYHTAGDDIQSIGVYADAQSRTRGLLTVFIDATVGYSGTAKPTYPGDWGFTNATFCTLTGLNVNGWTCKYPREIVDTSSIVFNDGDSPADNDKALAADGLIYQWDAGLAQWDLLGCCGEHEPSVNTVYRDVAEGDYLTLDGTVFNEIKTAADALVWSNNLLCLNTLLVQQDIESRVGNSSGTGSYAAAKTAAEADYAANAVVTGTGFASLGTYSEGNDDGVSWSESIGVDRGKVDVTLADNQISFTAEFFVYAENVAPILGSTPVFDANGTGYLEDDWFSVGSDGPNPITNISGWIGNNPNTPYIPNYQPDTTPGVENCGFLIDTTSVSGGFVAITKWNVVGGFTMVP